MNRRFGGAFRIGAVVAALAVAALLITPAGAHVTGSFRHLWRDHIKPRLANVGTLNAPTNPVDWTKLKGMPSDFADGIDDTGGGGGGGGGGSNLEVEIVTVSTGLGDEPNKDATAQCPLGKVVSGGGAEVPGTTGFKHITLHRSAPTASGEGWTAGAHQHSIPEHPWELIVNAICVVPTP